MTRTAAFLKFTNDIVNYRLKAHTPISGVRVRSHFRNYTNGCGAKGGMQFPGTMWFLSIVSACDIHDIDWTMATCTEDLIAANEVFDNNLKRIIDKDSNFIMKRLRRMRAAKYVTEVELIGTRGEAIKRGFDLSILT